MRLAECCGNHFSELRPSAPDNTGDQLVMCVRTLSVFITITFIIIWKYFSNVIFTEYGMNFKTMISIFHTPKMLDL